MSQHVYLANILRSIRMSLATQGDATAAGLESASAELEAQGLAIPAD